MDKDKVLAASLSDQSTRLSLPGGRKQISVSVSQLNPAQVLAIDRALQEIGEFGEVRLIVSRGHLRFIGKFKTEALGIET